eukprot:GILK01001250.1.p1 GENE.GILK01001250.1~~GILK01001250.1.p1  ORF type:complete len:113 (-),score=22.97 GILK01001250.1:181-519(-)
MNALSIQNSNNSKPIEEEIKLEKAKQKDDEQKMSNKRWLLVAEKIASEEKSEFHAEPNQDSPAIDYRLDTGVTAFLLAVGRVVGGTWHIGNIANIIHIRVDKNNLFAFQIYT